MKKALLIIDMSNDFVDDHGGLTAGKPAQQIVPYIVDLANRFLQGNHLVIFAMDAHQPNDRHFQEWPVHNVIGTWGQQLYGELAEWYQKHQQKENVVFLPKEQYDAFYETPLEQILREKGIEQVHLTGVATDICVFLTASGAYYRGFKTFVYKKGTATFTDQQDLALKHMNTIFKTEVID
ncbi:cysteine hydrolase family protein [Tepidibacillus sp. LV47]|uniref:cysteine hydrolase family protein n=1 Tax=Tepidibacillus sp. LV47 TaxID=3398228 RepID=UPI003AAC5078